MHTRSETYLVAATTRPCVAAELEVSHSTVSSATAHIRSFVLTVDLYSCFLPVESIDAMDTLVIRLLPFYSQNFKGFLSDTAPTVPKFHQSNETMNRLAQLISLSS